MLRQIRSETLEEVAALLRTWQGASWGKTAAIRPQLAQLDADGWWLLSFFSYLVSWNRVWKSLDEDPFYVLSPAPDQLATFDDFLELLRHYHGSQVNRNNEQRLVDFLSRCNEPVKELFIAVLARQRWLKDMFMSAELRGRIDAKDISPEDIYGGTTLLTEGWHTVSYPLVVTSIPEGELHPAVIFKQGDKLRIYKFVLLSERTGKTRRTQITKTWLKTDRRFLSADTFVLYGMIAEEAGEFFPLDYFQSLEEFQRCRRKRRQKPPVSSKERQDRLDGFLRVHYLRQIRKVERVYCYSPAEVEVGVGKALHGSPYATVLLCDGQGRTYTVTTEVREGVVDGVWQEAGQVFGVEVWSNARKIHCAFSFTGEHNALLYRSELLRGKHALFYHFHFQNFHVGAIKEILWDKKPYHRKRHTFRDGNKGYLERCPVCLRDDVKHEHFCGVCVNTYINWRSTMASHGVNTWFHLSRKIRVRRKQLGWDPHMINNSWINFRGHRVVADAEGRIMFKPDPEALEYYERAKKNPRRHFNALRKAESPEELHDWYLKNYKIKGCKEKADNESGDLREVCELHDHVPMEDAGEGRDPGAG